ncbi:hypothetical protein POTOM_014733 [Populus tomentosa]|uniref:DUF7075 domain-containing protein n=1 Tax=Populus tomentosa TaxID=118781 RepID=A0A8X8ACG1_POPTO|nr:hypothetical protein POTOM_014733 [Populus tomentosa]
MLMVGILVSTPERNRVNSSRSGRNNPKVAPLVQDNEINETIPRLGSETNFRNGKYLYHSRGGDYCKGMNQYVVIIRMGTDFRFDFDFEHLKETASIAEEGEFLRDWKKWNRSRKKKVPVKKVVAHKMTPMQPRKVKSTIIWRQFDGQEPENYWHRMCEGRDANGEKALNKELWPHLDADTSPYELVTKLQGMIQPWRNLYIATNEPFYNYFDKLRSHFKVHLIGDYKELWTNSFE